MSEKTTQTKNPKRPIIAVPPELKEEFLEFCTEKNWSQASIFRKLLPWFMKAPKEIQAYLMGDRKNEEAVSKAAAAFKQMSEQVATGSDIRAKGIGERKKDD